MLDYVNFTTTKGSNLFFTSDTHFHHDRPFIYLKRGYYSIKEHDDTIIDKWNKVVGPNDNVIHCGDFMCRGDAPLFDQYVSRLNGTIYMLFGNHNSGAKEAYRNEVQRQYKQDNIQVYPLRYNKKVVFLGYAATGLIDSDIQYVASHFAYRTWPYKQRKNNIHVCGHSHSNDVECNPDTTTVKRIDCGIDNFGLPVSFKDLMAIMDTKGYDNTDHHVPDITF